MWIEFSKIVVWFCFCANVVSTYYTKQDYIKQSEPKILSNKYSSSSVSRSSYNNDNFKVRQSRYPNLDNVMKRIDSMTSEGRPRIRHKGWSNYAPTMPTTTTTTTDGGLFDTYGDFDGDFDDYDDNLEDDDDEQEYEDSANDNDDSFFDNIEDVQAEEPTETPTFIPQPVSSLTEYKWRNFGSLSTVAESRRQHLNLRVSNQQRRVNAVLEHFLRVNEQGKCRKPSPKVIPVQKEYPDPSKTYTPHCTVLHRCAEDTGCCKHDTKCQWKSRVLVELYFYTKTLGSTETKVEKLNFFNHTECECKENSNYTSSEPAMDSSSALSFKSADSFYSSPQNVRRCKCPKHFLQKHTYDYETCYCDCDEGNLDCIQLKKGKEHLSMTDRICISNNDCGQPICEYGPYVTKEGKCPSKKDKIEEFRKQKKNY